jgi:hypothetical protein
MQPYFLPYIGYWQLMAAVDTFVIYDNIKYTKKGWINRNRMLQNGSDSLFSLPLKAGSDSLDVDERELSDDFDRKKLLAKFHGAYRKAPYFAPTAELLESVIKHPESNLFGYLAHSITTIRAHLNLEAEVRRSSTIDIDHDLKAQAKVLALCKATGASTYINTMGGYDLYSSQDFADQQVKLQFIRPTDVTYPQFGEPFVPWLSIIDVLMFNPVDHVRTLLTERVALSQ